MHRILILTFTLFLSVNCVAQQWDSWLSNHVWDYTKIYPNKYGGNEILSVNSNLDLTNVDINAIKVLEMKEFDAIPDELFRLKNLEVLDISWSNFRLSELKKLHELKQLKALNLWHTADSYLKNGYTICYCNDSLPATIGELKELEYLRLYDNGITYLPESFGGLTSLIQLEINRQPSLNIPDSFDQLRNLEVLNLNYSPSIPVNVNLTNLPKLTSLHLGFIWAESDKLSDFKWERLTNLTELQIFYDNGTLYKSGSPKVKVLPNSIFQLPSLTTLYWSPTYLSKADKKKFKEAYPALKFKVIK